MDRTYYLNLNYQYHDARIASMNKLDEIKKYFSLIEEYKTRNPGSNFSELKLPVSFE
uniref:Uncharacterized protein n=1 Tax=Panagrolaimus sp. ES5 TaxID=591445 RepID=A0AC34FQE4_9BILA